MFFQASQKRFFTLLTLLCVSFFSFILLGLDKKNINKANDKKETKKMTTTGNVNVILETSSGTIEVELFSEQAPVTVKNFLSYVDEEFYNGTIFHRVISGFMIQGGGMDEAMKEKKNKAPIKNEATNGLKNEKYTLAMARTNVVDSATSQFFINVSNNDFLNHQGTLPNQYGYAVFGKVVKGEDVVDLIAKAKTGTKGYHSDVPVEAITIKSIKRK